MSVKSKFNARMYRAKRNSIVGITERALTVKAEMGMAKGKLYGELARSYDRLMNKLADLYLVERTRQVQGEIERLERMLAEMQAAPATEESAQALAAKWSKK